LVGSIPDHLCGRCLLGEFYFERARSCAFYDGLLRDILHRFKYERKLSLGGILSSILIESFPKDLDIPDLVIPVPLYIDRLRYRGYNQSVILGVNLAKHLRVSFDPFVLKRIRDTKPQFEITGEDEKRKNVKGAFSIENFEKIRGKTILLIDDVLTTGSTINECTRVLLQAGASWVQVVTLMRAVQEVS
jgi:ComF family protein